MEGSSKKRPRKTKLVPREYLDSDDENIAQMQNEIEETISKINVQSILKKLEPNYFSSKSLEFSVKVEVEECNENIEDNSESHDEISEDLNIKIDSIRSLNEQTIYHYHIDDDNLREVFYLESQKTISTVDKMIEIYIRNNFGRQQVYIAESNIDKMLQLKLKKWKTWYEASPHLREAPVMYVCYVCNEGWWHFSEFREHLKIHDNLNFSTETPHQEFRIVAYKKAPESKNVKIESDCWKCGRDVSVHQQAEYRCRGCNLELYSCTTLCTHETDCQIFKMLLCRTGIDVSITYYCPLCPYKHWVQGEIQKHLVLGHSVRSDLPIHWTSKPCPRCNISYNDHRLHECPHRPMMYSCHFCTMTFQVKPALMFHLHNSKHKVSCRICNKRVLRGCMMPEHLLVHTSNYIIMFKCLLCDESLYFNDYMSITAHKNSVHADIQKKQPVYEKVILPKTILDKSKRTGTLPEALDTDTENEKTQKEIVAIKEISDNMKEKDYFRDELGIKVTVIDKSTVQQLMNDANVDLFDVNTDENETLTNISREAIDIAEQTIDNHVELKKNPLQKTYTNKNIRNKQDNTDEGENSQTVQANVEIKREIPNDIDLLDENVINIKQQIIDDDSVIVELKTEVKMEADDEVNGEQEILDDIELIDDTEVINDIKQEITDDDSVVVEIKTEVKMEADDEVNRVDDVDETDLYEAAVSDKPKRKRTAYNHTMAERPVESMDLTSLPLPSRSKILTEAQDAPSTSATPLAEPPTISARKSKAQKQREYRQRIAASRTAAQVIAARKSNAERQRNSRLRKAANSTRRQTPAAAPAQITVQPSTSSDQIEVQQAQSTWNIKWSSSIMRFKSTFLDNDFGYACSVCDRLWFKNDLKPITAAQLEVISEWFIKEYRRLCREEYEMICNCCKRSLNKKTMPPLAKVNGFSYPDQPPGLPPLDPISERLISPRLPFMQVRRLRHDSSYGIIGQVINVPVDVQEMVTCLPRQLNEDDVINVNIERNLAHNSVYISGYMSKSTISAWLNVLQKSPLYRLYEINVDLSRLNPTVPFLDDIQDDPSNRIENISAEHTPESEFLASRQHTVLWNEEDCLNIAPGHQAIPLDIIYDRNAEELSFPSIYFGKPRRFNTGVSVTPNMIATSEIRRRDRRGATPQKILYVAMKILRLRIVGGINSTFRNVSVTENVSRRMLEDTEFLKEYVIQNLAFMKTVPNSVQYWASRKRDLFAMIRQLGKPTVFLTISANEIRWIKLLTILLKLSEKYPGKTAKDLNTSERCTLVSDDPVTCCIYFSKLVGSLMKMLKSKQTYNPFGKYFVIDYFLRFEFQHQGSPHAHILLWLNDDPRETVSENMPRTIDLVEKLSSVARHDVPNDSVYANQIHKHTFTCTKRGETTCRFGIPYWPMPTTRVLVPIPQSDGRRQTLQQKAKELRTSLGERRYACMDEFLNANGLTFVSYLDIVRSTLRRPTLVFRRNFDELMTNTFNPYLAGEVNTNIAIQFVLDEYSCAEFVEEYVNKSTRGMSNLHRELTTMMKEHPDRDYTGQLKALSIKLLNAVEMSAQEAAWYLLRQPMSETSRQVVYIPTVWPTERQRCRKRRQQMDREGIGGDSTDVWTKNIIQRYEERPASLEQVYLAEFASWYANTNDFVDEEDDLHVDDDEDSEAVPEARTSRAPKEYRRRPLGRVIRYRRYDIDDTVNYKREMVLLYVQFRNEMSEIVDQNKFLQLFDDNKDAIMERRSLFETNLNIENVRPVQP